MPDNSQIERFTTGNSKFRSRLNEIVDPTNQLIRQFNERERNPLFDDTITGGHVLLTATETGDGHYAVTFVPFPVGAVDPTQNIVAAEFGIAGEKMLAVFPPDLVTGGHSLDPGDGKSVYLWAEITSLASTDGRRVVSITGSGSSSSPRPKYEGTFYGCPAQNAPAVFMYIFGTSSP